MDKRSSRDLLSNLPLGIIHAILERVPIRDAVRTSILSNQWKYKWATLPHLTFDDTTMTSSKIELEHFITQLLLLHQGPILKFKVDSQSPNIPDSMYQWLCFLSRNGIRMLSLRFGWEGSYKIPYSLYSCQSLTHLEIYGIDPPPPPPSFKSFLCLKCLVLVYVYFSSAVTLHTLFADLPLLEEMKLVTETCFKEELRVNAPNLKILYLNIDGARDLYIHAPLLSKMSIWLGDIPQKESSVSKYTEFLGGLTRLEMLKGDSCFFEFLSIGIESCHTPLMFPHLRFIQLSPEVFYDKTVESVIALLSKGAPNLHKIRVSCMYFSHSGLTSSRLDSECPFNFTFERLKVLEFDYPDFGNDVGGINCWMKLIKCALARSPALETLICVRPCISDSEFLEQTLTLLTYPRASPNAKIVFK